MIEILSDDEYKPYAKKGGKAGMMAPKVQESVEAIPGKELKKKPAKMGKVEKKGRIR
jgi:hypothetical protein